ncbi:MAG: YdeI/OmpD-associated family protein [Actinobacteria bacterium]|nr:YdeI/OmpD-associated family protein [Actinomycetota bacterium]
MRAWLAEHHAGSSGIWLVTWKKGHGPRLDEVETLREPDDLSAALDAAPDARGHGDVFPRSARRAILEWIASAKTEPTRDRRITRTVEEAASGRRANQWRQPKS